MSKCDICESNKESYICSRCQYKICSKCLEQMRINRLRFCPYCRLEIVTKETFPETICMWSLVLFLFLILIFKSVYFSTRIIISF